MYFRILACEFQRLLGGHCLSPPVAMFPSSLPSVLFTDRPRNGGDLISAAATTSLQGLVVRRRRAAESLRSLMMASKGFFGLTVTRLRVSTPEEPKPLSSSTNNDDIATHNKTMARY